MTDNHMKALNNNCREAVFELRGNGNRIDFKIKGNNSSAAFSATVFDSDGKSAVFCPAGGNYDFVFTDFRIRRTSIDLDGDKPENNNGCDFSKLTKIVFTLLDDTDGDVYICQPELNSRISYSAKWDKRRAELEGSYILTQNEVNPKIRCVSDIDELRELRDTLHAENGPFNGDFIRAEGNKFVHANGEPFTAIGANYLGINIWEPNIIKYFSPNEIDEDFGIMEKLGFTAIRFAFTHYIVPDENDDTKVSEESLLKLEVYLELARKHNLRVIFVGLDGKIPERLANVDRRVNNEFLQMMEERFENTARYFADNPTILGWNIYNEFVVDGESAELTALWNENKEQYPDFLLFKTEMGNRYIKRLSDAVRRGSSNHMVTCGTLQWSFPMIRPGIKDFYPCVDPAGFVKYVDFLCPHYYPIYSQHIFYPSQNFHQNIQALRGWINYCKLGKPILLEEFGCPGGGEFWENKYTQNHQLQFTRAVIDTLAADVAGFIYWPFQDTPGSTDISTWCGLIDVEKNFKQTGAEYAELIHTADRTVYPEIEYPIDFAACIHEEGSGGFGNYIHESLDNYINYLKNKEYDIKIVKKPNV